MIPGICAGVEGALDNAGQARQGEGSNETEREVNDYYYYGGP